MSGLNDENLSVLAIVKQVIFAIVQRIFLFDYNNEFQEILWKFLLLLNSPEPDNESDFIRLMRVSMAFVSGQLHC